MATVMTDDAGPIRIVLGSGGSGRLFGIPFLLVGLQHRSARKLSEFSTLDVDLLQTSTNQRSSGGRVYEVELANPDRTNQVVGLFNDPEDALAHARRLSALIGLPVEDWRFKDRPADE